MALRAKSTEEITVSSSAIGVTAGLLVSDGAPTGVVMGVFQHASGGDIHINPIILFLVSSASKKESHHNPT